MKPIEPSEIIRSPRLEIANRVSEMDTPMLRQELARALSVTAETLVYLAEIWKELERRGEDLSELRAGMGRYLPQIASNQIHAEVVVKFAGRISLLRAVGMLPIEEQKRLASGGQVKTLGAGANGKLVEISADLNDLSREQLRLVFDQGRIRSTQEQSNMIAGETIAVRRGAKEAREYQFRVDAKAGSVKVGKMSVPLDIVMEALREAGLISRKG